MDSSFILQATLIGLFAGVLGTLAGGILGISFKITKGNMLSVILGFAAGVMLTIVFMELMNETFEMDMLLMGTLGLIIGVIIFLFLDLKVPHHHTVKEESLDKAYLKKGTLMSLGIALHNFPEGLAIGVGFAASPELGITLALVIALHNIPEGLAVATPLIMANISRAKVLLITAAAGFPMAVGAFIGSIIGSISEAILASALGFAAGAMLYIVCDELIPDAYQEAENDHYPIMGILLGTVAGILLIGVVGS